MCGIVGYIGNKDALPILIEGLRRLEYRGYDSVGIAIIPKDKIVVKKCKGKIKNLEELLGSKDISESHIGISHNRWATHGPPTNINAHPHQDCSGDIAVVHNGIIENFSELKKQLIEEGHKFKSQTDTEVISHLVEKYYKGDLKDAVLKTLKNLKGSFALGVISKNEPDRIIAARKESPLIVGIGEGENFIASDVPAILKYTKKVIYLDDGEIAVLTKDNVTIFDSDGNQRRKNIDVIKWTLDSAQKAGFPHFMLKEIHEQPKVLKQIISSGMSGFEFNLEGISNIIIIACGTAYHAGLVGKYVLEKFTRIPVSTDVSSEFRYRDPIVNKNTLAIAISQSGETADTLAAVKEAKQKGAKILSVCNVVGSSLVRISDEVLYTCAGPEIGVASTKAYTAQLAILYMLAFYIADKKGLLKSERKQSLSSVFKDIPGIIENILSKKNIIQRIAARHLNLGSFLYLGRNLNFPTALEGALKLKEISYIPAEGYAAGEMKHGPIALIDEYRAVVCISPESFVYEKMVSNIEEICARKGKVIAIVTEGDKLIENFTKEIIYIPKIDEIFSPIVTVVPLQLLAYYIAVKRGCDVDQPRNLAKSVTVE